MKIELTRQAQGVVPLRPYQREAGHAILDSILHHRGLTITVMMARQAGKNELSAQIELLLLAANANRDVEMVKCAPTFRPQGQISLRRLWARIGQAGLRSLAAREEGHIVRLGRARQVFLSAEPQSNIVGHTAHLLLEADEAQSIDAEKFERDLRPMAAATAATVVCYGTAWDEMGLLERLKQHNQDLERRDGVRRHFEYDWEAVARHNPAYARFVEAERQRLGEGHPLFQTQYCLHTVSGGRLFNPSQRAQLQGTHAREHAPQRGEVYIAGLDMAGDDFGAVQDWYADAPTEPIKGGRPAAGGRDATILTIARVSYPPSDALVQEPSLAVVEHVAWRGERHDALYARLADLLGCVWQVRRVAVDATGLGEATARFLMTALGERVVIPFKFTSESKSRLGYNLLAAVNGGRLRMYAADGSAEYNDFWQEVSLARVAYRPNRTMNFFVAPSEGHDDYLMSLALVVEAATGLASRRIARGRLRSPLEEELPV